MSIPDGEKLALSAVRDTKADTESRLLDYSSQSLLIPGDFRATEIITVG